MNVTYDINCLMEKKMKGNKEVLDALNDILMAELTGINIYYIHYMMQEDWGYKKISSHSLSFMQ